MLSIGARSALREIRSKVATGKWIKHHASDGRGNYCISGHITQVPLDTRTEVFNALNRTMYKKYPHMGSLVVLNDHHDTKQATIIELIDDTLVEGQFRHNGFQPFLPRCSA